MDAIDEIVDLIGRRGDALHGDEAVARIQHALQSAALADHLPPLRSLLRRPA
jgi:predicted HD phosphohydrolase